MYVASHRLSLEAGPARLDLTPPLPPLWLSLAPRASGPASLCLDLLPLARPAWEGVSQADGRPARPGPASWAALPAGLLPRLLPALCPPWLSPEEEEELAGLEGYLKARADYPGLDCSACRDQDERGEGAPDCADCPRPQPPASAQVALGLAPLLAGGLQGPAAWVDGWTRELPPREAWRLAWRLAVLARWRGGGGGPSCPVLGWHANI